MILRDFQIYSPFAFGDRTRDLNWTLFPLYEAVRLDLKGRRPRAPFQKIVIRLSDPKASCDIRVITALGICEASVPVDANNLPFPFHLRDFVPLVIQGLEAIAVDLSFRDPAIAAVLERCAESDPPCAHLFAQLTRTSKAGIHCETWFLARRGHSTVEARLSAAGRSTAFVLHETVGPLWLEDDFPLRSSRIREGRYEVLDAKRSVLAQVPLDRVAMPG